MQGPFVIVALFLAGLRVLLGTRVGPHRIDWRETFAEMFARALVGLVIGVVIGFLLVPFVFWPNRHNPQSVFDALGHPDWIHKLFFAVLLAPVVCAVVSARATLQANQGEEAVHWINEEEGE
jgi:O-antigen/teichoic acid export membrane protein